MCVLALAWRAHPRWRLVLAANRDELHARPAAPLDRWAEADQVLGGRDLASGGTWLGVSEAGRLAVVTNLHVGLPPDPAAPSRGLLLNDLLLQADAEARLAPQTLAAFNPFNLIAIADDRASFVSNRPEPEVRPLSPGIYGLSNATLDTPWPKTERLKGEVAAWLQRDAAEPDDLLAALAHDRPDGEVKGPADTPAFIRNPVYGTRCSTVVVVDQAGAGTIVERRFDADARISGETVLSFTWPNPI